MNKVLAPGAVRWLLLLIPCVAVAFYPRYWSRIGDGITSLIHIHAFLLSAWVVMSIVQPYLILKKKTAFHRIVGRVSYVLMPLILATGYIMVQNVYDRRLDRFQESAASGKLVGTADEIGIMAAGSVRFQLIFFLLLGLFYLLAIVHRKNMLAHATYMMAAVFTVLDPTLDRIFGRLSAAGGIEPGFFLTHATQIIIISLLVALAIYQKRKGSSLKPALIAIGIYMFAFVVLNTRTDTPAWRWFVESLLFR